MFLKGDIEGIGDNIINKNVLNTVSFVTNVV